MAGDSSNTFVRRMRMARRVADALLPRDDGVVIMAPPTEDVLAGDPGFATLRSDFTVTVLDLRLRLSLLVGLDSNALDDPDILKAADGLLWSNPDTFACVLVADDDILNSRIVESGDGNQSRLRSGVRKPRRYLGPLRDNLAKYLGTINPGWPQPTKLPIETGLAFDEAAIDASLAALAARGAERVRIPERRSARESLGPRDAQWAADLAMTVAKGKRIDIDAELDRRIRLSGEDL